MHSGRDHEPADVGFPNLAAGYQAGENRGGCAGEGGGEGENAECVVFLREVEEWDDGTGEDEGGENSSVGNFSFPSWWFEENIWIHFYPQHKHVAYHTKIDDETKNLS